MGPPSCQRCRLTFSRAIFPPCSLLPQRGTTGQAPGSERHFWISTCQNGGRQARPPSQSFDWLNESNCLHCTARSVQVCERQNRTEGDSYDCSMPKTTRPEC